MATTVRPKLADQSWAHNLSSQFLHDFLSYAALVPGPVQNLRSSLDTNKHSLSLNWDKPNNAKASGDVTAYDIRFRPSESRTGEGYRKMTVRAPITSILLTEESGLQPLRTYDFEVRARNDGHEGKWSKLETTGIYVFQCV